MRAGRLFNLLLSLLVTLTLPNCARTQTRPPATADTRLVIRAARMLDARAGRAITDAAVVVEGDRVTAVGAGAAVPAGARVIDLGDVTLMPGLIDAHTHITYHFDRTGRFGVSWDSGPDETLGYAEENARETLLAGVTTARDLGGASRVVTRLRDLINRGEAEGPRLLVSGDPLTSASTASASSSARGWRRAWT
jgi:imidazolonepropionase-like amidohydrolase